MNNKDATHPEILLSDITLHRIHNVIRFGNSRVELWLSLETGHLLAVLDKESGEKRVGENMTGAASLLIRVGGELAEPGMVRNSRMRSYTGVQEFGHSQVYHQHGVKIRDNEVSLEITGRDGDWLLTSIYTLKPTSQRVERDCAITYTGTDVLKLRDVRLVLRGLSTGEPGETRVEAPDYPVPSHFPLSRLPEGIWKGLDSRPSKNPEIVQHSVDAPGSLVGLVGLHNPNRMISILAWAHSTSEFSIMELENRAGSINLVQWLLLSERFTTGKSLQAGRQVISIEHGNWLQVMESFQAWYQEIGLTVPPDRPAWANGTAIYEVHIGKAPFLNGRFHEPYPAMSDLEADLPRIARMGFEVLQIMPHWPFCGYSVHNYYQVDHQYGEEEGLRSVIERAHQLGLKVILDIVLHGCVDKEIVRWDMAEFGSRYDFIFGEWLKEADERSIYRLENPEWFMEDEQGEIARIYTWAFDHGSPSFQDYLVQVLKHYLSNLGVDGFRFDAPTWNCISNWKPGSGNRPSAAYYASHVLMRHLRNEIKMAFPGALFYTEPGGPLFRNTQDLTYNYDEEWLSGSIMRVISERGYAGARFQNGRSLTAQQVALWLQFRELSLPAGSQTVHHLDSHDTFWWGEKAQFRHEAFGIPASRALFAFFSLIGGGIMVYTGAEKGSQDFYTQLLTIRQKTPVLRQGKCDFLAIECDQEMVLPLLRTHGSDYVIPVINFSDQDLVCSLKFPEGILPRDASEDWDMVDLFNEETIQLEERDFIVNEPGKIHIPISAYGVRVLSLTQHPPAF